MDGQVSLEAGVGCDRSRDRAKYKYKQKPDYVRVSAIL